MPFADQEYFLLILELPDVYLPAPIELNASFSGRHCIVRFFGAPNLSKKRKGREGRREGGGPEHG